MLYGYTDERLEKTYLLKSHHLTDWDLIKNEELSFPVNFKLWGEENFVSGVVSVYKPYPLAFLTDQEGNILYFFSGAYLTASEIVDVTIENYNGDGLKDVRMITCFLNFPEEDCMEWLFLQRKNGMFDKALKRWGGKDICLNKRWPSFGNPSALIRRQMIRTWKEQGSI